ncbi:MAG: helix-turn-helix domain-containing protein [Actinomycetota bacterium]
MGKTKVIGLSDEQWTALEKGYRTGKSHAFRNRSQMIFLKSENRTSLEVVAILGGCEVVVNNWLKRFEAEGIKGLETRPGRGRPPILSQQNPEHLKKVKDEIEKHPNSVKTVIARLEKDFALEMSPDTLKRFLKKYRFCRARTWLKSRQVGAERAAKEEVLKRLWKFYWVGWIDLYFGDESAFSMNPKLPYGWSPKRKRSKIFPHRDKKINLFGVFRPDNFCMTYESVENINYDFLIRSLDDFCGY